MRSRIRVAVAGSLVVVSILLVYSTILTFGPINRENPPNEPNMTTTSETIRVDSAIYLRKVSEPEYYVELTEEELERFPALQAALQALKKSGESEIMYSTSYHEATSPLYYLEEKYQGQVSWNYIFKFEENFYSIAVAVP